MPAAGSRRVSRSGLRPPGRPVLLPAPVALRGKAKRADLGAHRQAQRRVEHLDHVISRHAGQVEQLPGRPAAGVALGRAEEVAAVALTHQRENEIAAHVQVVDGQDQLAEAGLPDVLAQQLGVGPGERRRTRLPGTGRAPQQAPQDGREGSHGRLGRERAPARRHQTGARSRRPRLSNSSMNAASNGEQGGEDRQRQHQRPRQHRGQERGIEQAGHQRGVGRGEHAPFPAARDTDQEAGRVDEQAEEKRRERQERHARGRHEPPGGRAQCRAHPVEPVNPAVAPEAVAVPQPGAAVDRRDERRGGPDAGAAATRSILTPASSNARRTPAW